jgi:type II secretory pathway pseudopilin PulG
MQPCKPENARTVVAIDLRRGTTLMEVLFAIGIVLVGLVGIAALIPLAGRQVVDSKTATLAASMAQNAYRSIEAANMHVPSTDRPWLIARDDPTHATGQQFTAYGSFSSLLDDEATWVASQAINGGVPNTVAIPMARAYASRRGYCIDPLFWASQPFVPAATSNPPAPINQNASSGDFPYRRSRFPYYHERFNPIDGVDLANASVDRSNEIVTHPTALQVDAGAPPRMTRITYAASPFAPYIPARARFAESLFASTDDVTNPLSSGDRSLNGIRGYFTQGSGMAQGENLMQVASSQGISWMATLAPLEQAGSIVNDQFRLSVVLFANRDRSFQAPGIADLRSMPNAEQVAWAFQPDFVSGLTKPPMGPAAPLSNEYSYCGENGFAVDLYWNSAYATPVKVGDWVMLSRRWRTAANSGNTILDELNTVQLHRWYRVVSAMTPQEFKNTLPVALPHVDPAKVAIPPSPPKDPRRTTRQSVQLLGPDWYFQGPLNWNDPQQRPTQATIVRGVSAVFERTVDIPME